MPLDVCYRREDGDHEVVFQLHDNAHYWFLHPWFVRLHKALGKYIDLYGDVELDKGSGLTALVQALAEAKGHAERQPKEWQVHVGTRLRPVHKELYETVRRAELLQVISRFQAVVERALLQDRKLDFRGD